MIRIFSLVQCILFLNSLIYEVNHVINWSMKNWESHCSHIRVLPIKDIFIICVSLYSSSNSLCSFNNLEFQIGKAFFVLKMFDNKSGIQSGDPST